MDEFIFRSEELSDEQIKSFYVETSNDVEILNQLKSQSPVVLVGSRGVGKSFLFHLSQIKLFENFESEKIFPVMVTFRQSSLVQTGNQIRFQSWMLSKIYLKIIRELQRYGYVVDNIEKFDKLSEICNQYQESWKSPDVTIDDSIIPSIDEFLEIVEDLCFEFELKRFVVYIDEAAHIFIPEQQRQFFTLFRDLRSAYIKCNASVYPGVTHYGNSFEPMHDAVFINLNRNILDKEYVAQMKEMVINQISSTDMLDQINRNGENFSLLAFASSGNPRFLLKNVKVALKNKFNKTSINSVIREFYREEIWSEHSSLAVKYPGNRIYIDWGRDFIEKTVLPEIKSKNDKFNDKSAYFWIHRDSPQGIKESLRLLEYTGIIKEHSAGRRATRGEIGTRYEVNIGCLLSLEKISTDSGLHTIKNLVLNRMSEFGANHSVYDKLVTQIPSFSEPDMSLFIQNQLNQSVNILDLTDWQFEKLNELNIITIGDLLYATEEDLMKARYIGEKKSRRMKNAAFAAVYEYLSG